MTGMNNHIVNELQFSAGCSRYGVENPHPTVRRRIALYGNTADVESLMKEVAQQAPLNLPMYASNALVRKHHDISVRDLMETMEIAPKLAKRAAVADIRLLSHSIENLTPSNPEAMLCKGVKIRLKDLEEDDQGYRGAQLTNYEVGMQQEKSIVVPSFGTTSVLFTRHLQTLRQLRRRVDLLKQAYYSQMDRDKCWREIDTIIDVMDDAVKYLGTEQVNQLSQMPQQTGSNDLVYDDTNIENDEQALQARRRQTIELENLRKRKEEQAYLKQLNRN
jgi:hypothetical protein